MEIAIIVVIIAVIVAIIPIQIAIIKKKVIGIDFASFLVNLLPMQGRTSE